MRSCYNAVHIGAGVVRPLHRMQVRTQFEFLNLWVIRGVQFLP